MLKDPPKFGVGGAALPPQTGRHIQSTTHKDINLVFIRGISFSSTRVSEQGNTVGKPVLDHFRKLPQLQSPRTEARDHRTLQIAHSLKLPLGFVKVKYSA